MKVYMKKGVSLAGFSGDGGALFISTVEINPDFAPASCSIIFSEELSRRLGQLSAKKYVRADSRRFHSQR